MIKILLFIIFTVINILLAKIDADKIKQHKPIHHGINGLIYLVLLIPVYFITYNWLNILGLLLLRIPVFNTSLNYFRGIALTYLSNSTTSIIDKITNKIPRKIGYWTYTSIILIISILLTLS
jgi:hypothetical protein